MPEPETCLSMDHIDIPENVAVVIYARDRSPRDRYVALSFTSLDLFEQAMGYKTYEGIREAFQNDKQKTCTRCDLTFEAHAKEDVSAEVQWREHMNAEHWSRD